MLAAEEAVPTAGDFLARPFVVHASLDGHGVPVQGLAKPLNFTLDLAEGFSLEAESAPQCQRDTLTRHKSRGAMKNLEPIQEERGRQ